MIVDSDDSTLIISSNNPGSRTSADSVIDDRAHWEQESDTDSERG